MRYAKANAALLYGLATAGAVTVAGIGFVVIFGWLLNLELLKSFLPFLATMKANTAAGFLAAGAALWLMRSSASAFASVPAARSLAILVAMVGGLTLAEYLFELDLHVDQLIFLDTASSAYPGRMAPVTAISFIFTGFALLALKARPPWFAVCSNWLAFLPLLLSMLAIVGYAYGVASLYKFGPYSSVALHTALSFFLLSLSILAADPTRGIGNLITSETAGGAMALRLLPTMPLAFFALGWLCLAGQRAGFYDATFGVALMVLVSTVFMIFAIFSTAVMLGAVDITRLRAEAELIALNADFEQRVRDRTRELAQLSVELTAANTSLEKLSLHDGLTNLANRRFFDEYIAGQIAVARRHKRPLALVLCDIDSFKAYNDHYGHQAGDDCLKQVAAALRSSCRRPADMAARYGGEEFALILPETDIAAAVQIAETARAAVVALRIPHGHSQAGPFISISGGVSMLMRGIDPTVRQLIAEADESLFQAKRLGRNRIVAVEAPLAPVTVMESRKRS